jgi:hypothetical protein
MMIRNNESFRSNYTRPMFIFENLTESEMFLENITVASEKVKNSGEPIGSGLIFTSNYLGNFSHVDSYAGMTKANYSDFVSRKKKTLEEWHDHEPVGHFKITDEEVSVDLDCKRMARYVCLLPLSFRNDSSIRTGNKNITCSFFGVSGKENKLEKPLANSVFLANKNSEVKAPVNIKVYAGEKLIYSTGTVPLT